MSYISDWLLQMFDSQILASGFYNLLTLDVLLIVHK